MKIEPISVHGSYEYVNEYGLKRWKKISIGATITEDDNVLDCISELDAKVEDAYKKISKPLSLVADNVPVPEVQVEKEPETAKLSKEDLQKKYLNDCKDEAELRTFSFLVKNNPHLQETFDTKLKQLQNV